MIKWIKSLSSFVVDTVRFVFRRDVAVKETFCDIDSRLEEISVTRANVPLEVDPSIVDSTVSTTKMLLEGIPKTPNEISFGLWINILRLRWRLTRLSDFLSHSD